VATRALRNIGADPERLFNLLDKNNYGYIDLNGFRAVSKHMGLQISHENIVKIFSMADRRRKRKLDFVEFTLALTRLRLLVAQEALMKTGFNREELMTGLLLSIVFLLCLFIFIFIGISAFSYASSFGAVVNSLLPASAGGAVASDNEDDDDSILKILTEAIEEALEDLKL
jgi:hypothetical protein